MNFFCRICERIEWNKKVKNLSESRQVEFHQGKHNKIHFFVSDVIIFLPKKNIVYIINLEMIVIFFKNLDFLMTGFSKLKLIYFARSLCF